MSVNINASTTNGLVLTSDTSGELKLQANGADIATVDSSGITIAAGKTITGISAGPTLKYITDSTDIAVTATADTGYSTIGSTFSVDIPTSGYIAMKNLVIKLINNEVDHYSTPVFGLRISSTNYWFTVNQNSVFGTYYAPVVISGDNTINNYTIINTGPHTGLVGATTSNAFGADFKADIIRLGIPTGTQTAQLIVGASTGISAIWDGDFTIKGTDVTTRVGLEFMAVS
jgi:hypothetical protein